MINIDEEINCSMKLSAIWEAYCENQDCVSPIFQKEIEPKRITFLSLNPSLPPALRQNVKKGFFPEKPYSRIDSDNRNGAYPFFYKFYDLNIPSENWSFLDLLYIRNSSQKELESLFQSGLISSNKRILNFFFDQITLTFEILRKLQPIIVVVANKYAGILIHKYIDIKNIPVEHPSESNGMVYKIHGIPFIIKESQYMGSRIHVKNTNFQKRLTKEITRVKSNIISE